MPRLKVGLTQLLCDCVIKRRRCVLDIDREGVIRLNKPQRHLRVLLVRLHAVGQAHGVELRAVDAVARQLGELAGESGILAAGNAKDKALRAGRAQVVHEVGDAGLNLSVWIDKGLNTQLFYDGGLEISVGSRHAAHCSGLEQ